MQKLEEENTALNLVIEEFTTNNKENQKYIDDLNFDITNLKISVSSFDESETSINEMVDRINLDIQNNIKSIENKKLLREEIVETNKKLEDEILKTKEAISNLEKEVLNSSGKVDELKKARKSKNEKMQEIEKELEEQAIKIEDLKNQISKLDVRNSKIELELNQIVNKMWEDYELTPNNTGNIKRAENVNEVQKIVNTLRAQIKELGSVNIDSIKEYKELKERYDFMSEQRLDLEEAGNKLRKVINEITNTM